MIRRFSSTVSRIQSLVASKNYGELSKAICANGVTSDRDWKEVADSVINLITLNKNDPKSASLVPSLVIASAASGHALSSHQRMLLSQLGSEMFESLSPFDKVVFTIGCSQSGLRTTAVVDFVNRFLTEARADGCSEIPQRLVPSLLLAIATLGIDNQQSWNQLLAKLDVESLNSHDLTQTALAVATSRTFPISSIERIIDTAVSRGADTFSFDDAVCLCHSLSCLEVFHRDLFRGLLVRVANTPGTLDLDAKKLMEQVILSLFLDEKARDIVSSVSPVVLGKLDRMFDWSVPEPQRHHGMIAGEIQQILSEMEPMNYPLVKSPPVVVGSLADWNPETAASVAMDRFYVPDVGCEAKIFFHVDDETYPDVVDGPLDPYLQLKHAHVRKCGWKLVWVREQEWLELEESEKKDFIKSHL